jgi:hypothetical protein
MRLTWLVEGLAIGSLGMYFFDPNRGRRRRAELRDRTRSRIRHLRNDVTIMGRDFYNRSRGAVHDVTRYASKDTVSDEVLCERIRASLGRCVTHPHSIQIEASDGRLILRGDILASEIEAAVHCAKRFAGTYKVQNDLVIHGRHDGFPGLQGEGRLAEPPDRWTPAMSLVMSVLGAGMAVRGFRRGDAWGGVLAAIGTGMVAKGFSDTEHRNQATKSRPNHSRSNRETEEQNPPLRLSPPMA